MDKTPPEKILKLNLFLSGRRFEHGIAEWEARTLPLRYAFPHAD